MLIELKKTRQIPGESFRRWFSGDHMELIVWYNEECTDIKGFQFCYQKGQDEKAISWRKGEGYAHTTLDDGEGRTGRHKMSPILLPDGIFDSRSVFEIFQKNSKQLDQDLVAFISHKISEYP